MIERQNWIDQARGFAMFLVVYGHNFPISEKYIYTFHMPLFIIISGFFLPESPSLNDVKNRFKSIILPYFSWALLLFLVWVIIGRNMGESANQNLSISKNFFGVFYAQGGQKIMDWGVPMWFLPCIFVTFFLYYLLKKHVGKYFIHGVILTSMMGFLYSHYIYFPLFWSIDIAMISLFFLVSGKEIYPWILENSKSKNIIFSLVFLILNIFLYYQNTKIDMYRSHYGNPIIFIVNGFSGSLFILLFFRLFPYFHFLKLLGKITLIILALHLLAMSGIKFFIKFVLNSNNFNFTEIQKFIFSILQIILILPIAVIINKYFPFLNGSAKKI